MDVHVIRVKRYDGPWVVLLRTIDALKASIEVLNVQWAISNLDQNCKFLLVEREVVTSKYCSGDCNMKEIGDTSNCDECLRLQGELEKEVM